MNPNQRTRILFYCQSLQGIGHLTASLHVIKELLHHSDVDLIYGGHDISISLEHPSFRMIRLSTLLIDNDTGELHDPSGRMSSEELWPIRRDKIESFLQDPYHAIIVEFFPFGRRRLKNEIHQLFKTVQEKNGFVPIFSFVREVLVPESLESEERMVKSVNNHIHTVFIRGDPNVIRFEDTFSLTHKISDKLFYTGYLGTEDNVDPRNRKPQILVSQGGGSIGRELLEAAIQTAPLLPDYQFIIATGSKTSATEFDQLNTLVTSNNVKIVPFLQNFKHQLMESALSISMGGDNTLMDVISTKTPGLAFPYPGNSEQDTRINKLSEKGYIHSLSVEDLHPERLCIKIRETLNQPYPDIKIAMNGAWNMSEKIKAILSVIR